MLLKSLSISVENPEAITIAVRIIAFPVDKKVILIANGRLNPLSSSTFKRLNTCNVSSTAIPNAIEKIIDMVTFISTPTQPINPPTTKRGIMLGNTESNIIRQDLKISPMMSIRTATSRLRPSNMFCVKYKLLLSIKSELPVIR